MFSINSVCCQAELNYVSLLLIFNTKSGQINILKFSPLTFNSGSACGRKQQRKQRVCAKNANNRIKFGC